MIKDPFFRNHLIRDGILRAIQRKMREDNRVYILGEGAYMKVRYDAPEILAEFRDRIVTLPISEGSNVDFCVGLSLAGLVPICDCITADFLLRAMDAICNTCAKQESVGEPRTIVIRGEFLTGGPTTGSRWEGLFARVPGLSVVVPSNPVDAYGLMITALEHPGVVVFFEDRMIEDATTQADELVPDPERMMEIPFGRALLRRRSEARQGNGLTIVSYGLMTRRLDLLLKEHDVSKSCDHLDLRTLWPLDIETIKKSVDETGALLVVEPDVGFMGVGAEIVAQVAEVKEYDAPGETTSLRDCEGLHVDIARLGGPRATIPASRELHDRMFPSDEEILREVRRMVS